MGATFGMGGFVGFSGGGGTVVIVFAQHSRSVLNNKFRNSFRVDYRHRCPMIAISDGRAVNFLLQTDYGAGARLVSILEITAMVH